MIVTMTDTFLSGWGESTNKISKYVVVCEDVVQAELIALNAEKRSDMRTVRIEKKMPYYSGKKYHTKIVHFNELGAIWKKEIV